MRKIIKNYLEVLLISGVVILLQEVSVHATPKIQFDTTKYNFGKIKEGEKVQYSFKFKNIGDEPLHLKKLISTCDCTAAIASKKELAPQEEGKITAVFDSTKKVTNDTKLIKVYSNDPEAPHVILMMEGEVIPEVKIEPEELNFGNIKCGKKDVVKELKVSFPTNDKLKVEKISKPHSKYIDAKIISTKNNETIIEVKIKKDVKVGKLVDTIDIFTTSKIYPVKRVVIGAVVEGDIRVEPAFLLIGNVNEKDRDWKKEIILSKSKEESGYFKIKKVEDTTNIFSIKILELKKGNEYKIELTLNPNLKEGKVMGKLKVHTNLPYQEIIEISVYGMIKGSS